MVSQRESTIAGPPTDKQNGHLMKRDGSHVTSVQNKMKSKYLLILNHVGDVR